MNETLEFNELISCLQLQYNKKNLGLPLVGPVLAALHDMEVLNILYDRKVEIFLERVFRNMWCLEMGIEFTCSTDVARGWYQSISMEFHIFVPN